MLKVWSQVKIKRTLDCIDCVINVASLFSYITRSYFHPPPTFCCFCQLWLVSLAPSSLLVSLPLPKDPHLWWTLPLSAGTFTSHGLPTSPSRSTVNALKSSVPKPTWDLQVEIARWKEEFMGSHDQTMGSREVPLDGRNDQSQDCDCPPNFCHLCFSRCVDSALSYSGWALPQGRRWLQ